jgi:esterase/lipase
MANIDREYVSIVSPTAAQNPGGSNPCMGLYHTPAGKKPKVAFIAAHYDGNNSEQYLAPYLAERGYGFLGWNTRFRGNGSSFLLEHALIDIGAGVRWLKEKAGVERIVILGNSGGGSLMAAYHSQALGVTMTPTPDLKLPDALNDLIAGDFYISVCAHRGRPEVFTSWLDPSVTDESDPMSVDPELDMFNPKNGPAYSKDFIARYRAAQDARNHRITAWVHGEIKRLKSLGRFDRAFNVHRDYADLRFLDGSIDPSDRPLNHCYAGVPYAANYGPRGLAVNCTLRTWLSMWSLSDSHCIGAPHLKRIIVPSLVIQGKSDAGIYPCDAEFIHETLGAKDKHLEMIPGDHYLLGAEGARAHAADIIAAWLDKRT